jgi:hypothetical protein
MTTFSGDAVLATINFQRELDRVLQLLAAQRAAERRIRQTTSVLQRGETAEAQAVLAAQLLVKRRYASGWTR